MDRFGRVNGSGIDGAATMGLARFGAAVFGTSTDSMAGDAVMVDPQDNEFCLISRSDGP